MPTQSATLSPAAIALNRFGLGARPGDAAPADPQRSITDQFARFEVRPARFAALADAGEVVARYREQQQASRRIAGQDDTADAKATLKAEALIVLDIEMLLELHGATSFAFAIVQAEAVTMARQRRPNIITSDVRHTLQEPCDAAGRFRQQRSLGVTSRPL